MTSLSSLGTSVTREPVILEKVVQLRLTARQTALTLPHDTFPRPHTWRKWRPRRWVPARHPLPAQASERTNEQQSSEQPPPWAEHAVPSLVLILFARFTNRLDVKVDIHHLQESRSSSLPRKRRAGALPSISAILDWDSRTTTPLAWQRRLRRCVTALPPLTLLQSLPGLMLVGVLNGPRILRLLFDSLAVSQVLQLCKRVKRNFPRTAGREVRLMHLRSIRCCQQSQSSAERSLLGPTSERKSKKEFSHAY